MVDDSTEELLKGTVKRNDNESSDEDNAIEIDIHNLIGGRDTHENDSTRALLLGRSNIHEFDFNNVLHTPDSVYHSIDNNDIKEDMYNEFKGLGISQNNNNELNALQYDTVLNDLYISISQFLARNQLSQAFITTFKKYVNNLIQEDSNPLKDKYILSLQTEIHQNDRLTPHLEHLISMLLLEPQNLIMRLTHYQINTNYKLLRKNFLKWRILINTNSYQTKLMDLYENYIKNKFLIKWLQKYRYYKQNERIKSVKANELRLKYMVFDKLLYKFDSIDKMQQLADTQFLNHIFQKLKTKREKIEQLDDDFDNTIIKPLLLKKYFEIWRLNVKLSTYRPVPTKRHIFYNWNKKLNNNEKLVQIADIAKRNKLLDTNFRSWRSKSIKCTEKLLDLQKSDGHVLKLKYFKKFIQNYKLLTTEEEFIVKRNSMIKEFYFSRLLKKKFEDKLHYYSLMQIKNDTIRKKYFAILEKKFSQSINSTNFLMDSMTKKYLRLWRLKYRQRATTEEKILRKKKEFFMKWLQKFRHQKSYAIYEKESILKATFNKWKQKNKVHQEIIYRAQSYNSTFIERKFLKVWLNKTSINVDLYLTADLFRNSHLFHVLVNRYETTKGVRIRCENENIKPIINHTLRFIFELWKVRSEARRQFVLNDKLQEFVSYRDDKLKRKYLTITKKRYSLINQHFESRAQTLERRYHGRLFFRSVIRKLEKHDQMSSLALESYKLKLIRNHMETWINKYDNTGRLEEILLDHLDEININTLSRYLSLWSVQSLKMERDNNSVRAFRNRWDRASIRGLLMLWKEKHEHKYSVNDNVDVEQQLRPVVQTPGREIIHDRDTIRGSATVRRNKMDARISRFKRAIPSPYKNGGNSVRGLANDIINPRPGQLQFSEMTDLKPQQSGGTPLRTNPRIISPHNIVDNESYLKGSPRSRNNLT